MNKKLLNQIYNIIFYSFAICSAGYFIISSIQKNEGLKSSGIIYIIFVIALLIPKKKIKFNMLRIILLLNLVDIIFYHSFQDVYKRQILSKADTELLVMPDNSRMPRQYKPYIR